MSRGNPRESKNAGITTALRLFVLIAIILLLFSLGSLYRNRLLQHSTQAQSLCINGSNISLGTETLTTLTNFTNSLYGIPNQTRYHLYWEGTAPPTNGTLLYAYNKEYGLNFTKKALSTNVSILLNQSIGIPWSLTNITVPYMVSTYVLLFENNQSAVALYKEVTNNVNSTIYYHYPPNTISIINVTHINGISNMVAINKVYPAYGEMQVQAISFPYRNYYIYVETWGAINSYNQTYSINIARHLYNRIKNMTESCTS